MSARPYELLLQARDYLADHDWSRGEIRGGVLRVPRHWGFPQHDDEIVEKLGELRPGYEVEISADGKTWLVTWRPERLRRPAP